MGDSAAMWAFGWIAKGNDTLPASTNVVTVLDAHFITSIIYIIKGAKSSLGSLLFEK